MSTEPEELDAAPPDSQRRRWVLPAFLVLWLIAAAVTAVILDQHRPQSQDSAVMAVAATEATNFFDLDSRSAAQDVERVLSLATGDFRTQYAAQRSSILASLAKQQLSTTTNIPQNGVGVEYLHADQARALVAIDVTATTSAAKKAGPSTRQYRVRLDLTRVHGTWLVSALDEVS